MNDEWEGCGTKDMWSVLKYYPAFCANTDHDRWFELGF